MNSRKLVLDALEGKNKGRAPRQLWLLPWASINYPEELGKITLEYPDDIITLGNPCREYSKVAEGNPTAVGLSTDEWGCVFNNAQEGVIGEVKNPQVQDDDWEDADKVTIPYHNLTLDVKEYNQERALINSKFVMASCCPRPFEQLQFIRGTENLFMDLMDPPEKMLEFMAKMHKYYCDLIELWCNTDCDGIWFMDDWGSQRSLLINPTIWRKLFKPMYKDYIDIAKKYGKKTFMHSDGYTLEIIDDLIEIGLDAFNTQIFCIGVEKLAKYKGKITFWGEIDRQHLLVEGSKEDIQNAVKSVYDTLYDDGYCIAQCEFGAGAKPELISEVFASWDRLTE